MEYANALRDSLSEISVEANKLPMEAYMKNHFKFFGIKSPERKDALRKFISAVKLPTENTFEEEVKALWLMPERELQYCAMEIVHRAKWARKADSISLIEFMITEKSWWDTVDFIAASLCGEYFKFNATKTHEITRSWNQSNNMWLIRSSILFQLKYKELVDLSLLEANMLPHLSSKEFFIQKAIGWALRQVSKSHQDWVQDFVDNHELKPVSKREAIKYL